MSSNRNIPEWKSNIPETLLKDVSPTEKWIMEEISKQGQCQSYLLEGQFQHGEILEKQNLKLESIELQCLKTNGRVTKHDSKFEVIDDIFEDVKQIVDVKRNAVRMLSSKVTYVIGGLIILGLITVVKNPALQDWISTFLF